MNVLAELIEKLSYSMQQHEADVTARSEFGHLSVVQIHYLDAIRHLGTPSVSDVATHLGVSKPTATVAVERLATLGFVRKTPSTVDRRVSHIHLTEQGMRISDLHDEIHRGYARYFEEALSPAELRSLIAMLGKVVQHLKL